MEGFTAFVELWTWDDDEESVRQRIQDAFPVSKNPAEKGFDVVITQVRQNTHRPRNQK